MKLHFDPNQQYQYDAMNSIVNIFEGQPLSQGDFGFSLQYETYLHNEVGVGNRLLVSEEQILKNIQVIQETNGIAVSEKLDGMNFSVEMETGTGKTYVYLRTIYELNNKYGFKKFVIVVPSIAIREGVLKNLEITFDHFQSLYDKTPVNFEVYDSKRVSNLRNFAVSNNIQILVINIDSFAKDENIINKTNDKLTGKKPVEFIQATSPIVIIDEPQNMETEILEILKESGRIGDVLINPQLFLDNTITAIKDTLSELMIDGIKYEKIGDREYEMRLFEEFKDVKYKRVAFVSELD
ncbi:MAG: hypothetical protein C0403_18820 [Desulfobacterium sp.]|nr:hypothetical protein [Desulfobacterium sp.]